jgi:hypothetical protein
VQGQKCLYLLGLGMVKNWSLLKKVVGAALIFLTLASTVVVVVQSCHGQVSAPVAAATDASHTDHLHPAPPVQSTSHSGLLSEICAGIFYLVLLLGGKFLLRISSKSYKNKVRHLTTTLIAYRRRVSFNLTLSLPQLGICRI